MMQTAMGWTLPGEKERSSCEVKGRWGRELFREGLNYSLSKLKNVIWGHPRLISFLKILNKLVFFFWDGVMFSFGGVHSANLSCIAEMLKQVSAASHTISPLADSSPVLSCSRALAEPRAASASAEPSCKERNQNLPVS